LSQKSKDAFVLVQGLEAGEEPEQQLEFLPFAVVECLLRTISDTLHCLHRNLRLDLVAIQRYCRDERDLEGLLDDSALH
jgi:hypothetical protein